MSMGLLGTKVGMTQVYDDAGKIAPVTVIQLGPCRVLQVRTPERDGYHAVQLGFKDKKRKSATRAERGHVAEDLESKRRKNRRAAGVEDQRLAEDHHHGRQPQGVTPANAGVRGHDGVAGRITGRPISS